MMEFADGRGTGRTAMVLVTYILEDFAGIEDGYCIMATSLVSKDGEGLQGADLQEIKDGGRE